MKDNLTAATELLISKGYTCVITDGKETLTSNERGVKPLLKLLDEGRNFKGFVSADKVIGKAAAMLYVLLRIDKVHALVISDAAAEVFENNGIPFSFDKRCDRILNRTATGFCPMEQAVIDIHDPEKAPDAVRKKLKELAGDK